MISVGKTFAAVMLAGLATFGCSQPAEPPAAAPAPARYEVWLVDQSNSKGMDHGGTLYIYAGESLNASRAGATPAATIDLGAETTALCREKTGANPVRPHMVLFNAQDTHATVAFVASGHVAIFDASSRKPVDCLRTSEAPTGRQAHAAFPSPDGTFVLVANQNGKRLERIDADFAANRFVHNIAATLDLAACRTPSGAACQAADVRPDNAPICPVVSQQSDLAFVTLRGGGMLVVDPKSTPMRIVAEYDMATVKGNGCGGAELGGSMYVNSGGRPGPMAHLHMYGFDVYRFPLDEMRKAATGATTPNTPAPAVVFQAEGEHDSHGMVTTGNDRYLWVMDRHADTVEVLGTTEGARVQTIGLNGALTDNAAPDLADRSPAGDLVFVAFRGPTPLSGDPHNATGSTPGMGIIEVTEDGRNGRLAGIIRVSNVGADGVERADPHGLRVRRLPAAQ